MKKRIFAATLAAIVALTAIMVTGCSGSDENGVSVNDDVKATNDDPTESNEFEPEVGLQLEDESEPLEIPEYIIINDVRLYTSWTDMSLPEWGINDSDVELMRYMVNLTYLYLSNNQISNINALAGLTNLEFLHLGRNQISDVSPLAGLTNLQTLALDNVGINDISALVGLTNLTVLILFGNPLNDISVLTELPNLTELGLSGNQVSDISELFGLTNLERLDLLGVSIDDDQLAELRAALPNTEIYVH